MQPRKHDPRRTHEEESWGSGRLVLHAWRTGEHITDKFELRLHDGVLARTGWHRRGAGAAAGCSGAAHRHADAGRVQPAARSLNPHGPGTGGAAGRRRPRRRRSPHPRRARCRSRRVQPRRRRAPAGHQPRCRARVGHTGRRQRRRAAASARRRRRVVWRAAAGAGRVCGDARMGRADPADSRARVVHAAGAAYRLRARNV